MMMIQQLITPPRECWEDRPEGDITNTNEVYDDVRQHQRRSDGYIIIKNDCISFREAIAELCVSCTSRSLTFCMSECLHELCVSYINVSDDKCVGESGRTSCGEWFIINW